MSSSSAIQQHSLNHFNSKSLLNVLKSSKKVNTKLLEFSLIYVFERRLKFFFLWVLILDLEWKVIYVGSAESEACDQILDSVFVGPVPEGRHMFVFQVS